MGFKALSENSIEYFELRWRKMSHFDGQKQSTSYAMGDVLFR